jgi:hypothetical protein
MNARGWKISASFSPAWETSVVSTSGPGGLARELGPSSDVFLIADRTVASMHSRWLDGALGSRVRSAVHIEADERFKTLSTASGIVAEMHDARLLRDATVVGFGGGLVCDIAAFCSSLGGADRSDPSVGTTRSWARRCSLCANSRLNQLTIQYPR